jgi:23S rRNA pseudouridine2604 synthase
MSELDLCSRREADRLIRDGKISVDGQAASVGGKVPFNLNRESIQFLEASDDMENLVNAVVLNKPKGYVSGQAEHGNLPAVRLLSRDRLWEPNPKDDNFDLPSSFRGFAPAGRLDLASTGLLVFSSSGIVAKKLIHHNSLVEKEYSVDVCKASSITKRERQIDPTFRLPEPTLDLSSLLEGGRTLIGSDSRPLLPCVNAEWTDDGRILRIVLTEGRKHHIRRLCREILGFHVVQLKRIRIGPIHLDDLPEGCWRPLTRNELDIILC